jgi:hypothetical protein
MASCVRVRVPYARIGVATERKFWALGARIAQKFATLERLRRVD